MESFKCYRTQQRIREPNAPPSFCLAESSFPILKSRSSNSNNEIELTFAVIDSNILVMNFVDKNLRHYGGISRTESNREESKLQTRGLKEKVGGIFGLRLTLRRRTNSTCFGGRHSLEKIFSNNSKNDFSTLYNNHRKQNW